jgi:hypothetical protein
MSGRIIRFSLFVENNMTDDPTAVKCLTRDSLFLRGFIGLLGFAQLLLGIISFVGVGSYLADLGGKSRAISTAVHSFVDLDLVSAFTVDFSNSLSPS